MMCLNVECVCVIVKKCIEYIKNAIHIISCHGSCFHASYHTLHAKHFYCLGKCHTLNLKLFYFKSNKGRWLEHTVSSSPYLSASHILYKISLYCRVIGSNKHKLHTSCNVFGNMY